MLPILMTGFLMFIVVAVVIYMLPAEPGAKRRKKRNLPDPTAEKIEKDDKDWKAIAERWEKNNVTLLVDIEKLKMQEKKFAKTLEDQKAQHKELIDKLSLEKGWREKEQVNSDKSRHHEKDLKDQIIRTEKDLEREHSERLRLEREYQELKIKHEAIAEEKREASTKAMSLETTVNTLNKEIKELKSENAKLKVKREDIQWVAKSTYDELKKELEGLQQKNGA